MMNKDDRKTIARIIKGHVKGKYSKEIMIKKLSNYFYNKHQRESKILLKLGMITGYTNLKKIEFIKDCGINNDDEE